MSPKPPDDYWLARAEVIEPLSVADAEVVPLTCPVCGATDHEQGAWLFGLFPVVLCPELQEQRIVLAPPARVSTT